MSRRGLAAFVALFITGIAWAMAPAQTGTSDERPPIAGDTAETPVAPALKEAGLPDIPDEEGEAPDAGAAEDKDIGAETVGGDTAGVPSATGNDADAGHDGTRDPDEDGHGHGANVPFTMVNVAPPPPEPKRRIHPPVLFLGRDGEPVIETGGELSLMLTCGQCHDTDYIETHNYHAQAGLDELRSPGETASERPWDISPGMFGRWSPLTYRVLTPEAFGKLDLGTADWVRVMGPRHVGGGPAMYARDGKTKLAGLEPGDEAGHQTSVIDPDSGEPVPWDWKKSGGVELNCLMCHIEAPDNVSRVEALKEGHFRLASTATLAGSGMVRIEGGKPTWDRDAFDADGHALDSRFKLRDPASANCRLCHGNACRCTDPVIFENSLNNWSVETTGEIFSPSRMMESGMNLAGKTELSRPWDIHAERLLDCSDCHYSMNNPKYNEKELATEKPEHLAFDARKLNTGDYLVAPDHNLAKGHNAQGTVARRLAGSMRDCRDCHDPMAVHDFLPYKAIHFHRLSCQTCHISRVRAPARKTTDWTLLAGPEAPVVSHRGIEGPVNTPASLITGYEPLLLPHEETDGHGRFGPHNVIASWFWVEGDPARPVRLADLRKALFTEGGDYHPSIVRKLDEDDSGVVEPDELRLDTAEKVESVRERLVKAGISNPRIEGEVQPYTLSHGVATGEFAIRDCMECHSSDSRLNSDIELAGYVPGGVVPAPVRDSLVEMPGEFKIGPAGALVFSPRMMPDKVYIHGADRFRWLDWIGLLSVIGGVAGIAGHGAIRVAAARRKEGESES